jgi:endonuclease/exonuclease/phosphatase (EEP) superfamily protein YafD
MPCRIYQQMLQLETAQVQQPGSLAAADVAAAYADINARLNSLAAQGDDIEDTATRSALLYMDALFNSSSSDASPSTQQQQQQDDVQQQEESQQQVGQTDTGNQQAAAAEPTSSSSSSSSSSISSARGAVSLQKLQRLGKFLAAAASLEPFQALLAVLSEKQPHLASEEMLLVSTFSSFLCIFLSHVG